jgi:adenylate cyclase
MAVSIRNRFYYLFRMMIIWTGAFLLFRFLRFYGLGEFGHVSWNGEGGLQLREIFTISILLGSLTGVLYVLIEWLLDRPVIRTKSYGLVLVLKTFLYFILIKILMALAFMIFNREVYGWVDRRFVEEALRGQTFLVFMVYFLIVSAVITFIRQMDQKFGPGVLWNMLIGKYHKPREEERIFMFIDLKDSTTIAEELGHIQFSRLIQDCFNDLTDAVIKHRAEIYQYVGDEVILCWKAKLGLKDNNCIDAFFSYQQTLEERADYYLKNYGLQPIFKAGVHVGKATVTEVGALKRDLAYHGDVVNTTARIQGQCNRLEQKILISKSLFNRLAYKVDFQFLDLGMVELKGKETAVEILGLNK